MSFTEYSSTSSISTEAFEESQEWNTIAVMATSNPKAVQFNASEIPLERTFCFSAAGTTAS